MNAFTQQLQDIECLAFQLSPAPQLVTRNRVMVDCNEAFLQLFGYSRDELLEKSFEDLTHPDDYPQAYAEVLKIVSGETDGMQAFMGGKLRAEGDMMLAMKLSELFPS